MEKVCVSCKRRTTNVKGSTEFPCPNCSKQVVRCENCRRKAVRYFCSCGFSGPN